MYRSLSTRVAAAALAAVALTTAPVFAKAHAMPSPAATATPSPPPEDPAITRLARREFVSWQAGNLDLSRYSDAAKPQLTAEKISTTSKGLGQLGALVSTEWLGPIGFDNAPTGVKGYMYRMVCTQGAVYEQIVIDAQGKITGMVFRDKLIQ